jgi:transposase-like protein
MQRKIIPAEIKNEILAKAKAGERVMELAKQYGVSDKSIYTWLHRDTSEEVISIVKYNKLKRENEELKRLVGELSLGMSLEKKGRSR